MRAALYKIEYDLKEGRKKKACDRLRNLINTFPDDISLRKKLGHIYYDAGFLDEAGKFWILCEPENDDMKKSVDIYRQSLSNSGNAILKDIVFRGNKYWLDSHAKNVMKELEDNSLKMTNHIPDFKPRNREKESYQPTKDDFWIGLGFYSVIGLVIVSLILGIFRLFELFVSLFFG
ncbi:DUF6584 family protein [Chryseobacterium pennipullorum]|uniref:Tetratricopeptide repeat protein n=1 Tax=Chryseobacterium pennipullorum TaxID=2258963 RepID=A0A3D9B585_9FLAO|nr:DUF6584 family protein [Chryseobacterium pennipullorum]REC48517.1 hypothetical protein DRF67_06730 [Chryseobacterium pennipullorum]